MRITLGVIAVLFGSFGLVGQAVSVIDVGLARRLGFQEAGEHTEPLYQHLEANTARWDVLTLWTLPVAGVLMLMDHGWWAPMALLAGGVHFDAGGRELAKFLGLRSRGVRVGSPREIRTAMVFLSLLSVIGAVMAVYALTEV